MLLRQLRVTGITGRFYSKHSFRCRSCNGREELTVIQSALDNVEHPCVFLLGGMKPDDSIDVMENVLSNGTADSILTTGIVGNIVLWAAGVDIGQVNRDFIASRGYEDMVEKSKISLKDSVIKLNILLMLPAK